jgi:hypothetical protein
MKRLLAACLFLAPLAARAAAYKPYHVLALSGTASLTRFEDEAWPLEEGQELPGDFTLSLKEGALIRLRAFRRCVLSVAGPAQLRSFELEHQEGELLEHDLVLRLEEGQFLADARFLLMRPSQIRLDLGDRNFELKGGAIQAFSVEPGKPSLEEVSDPRLLELRAQPVKVLLLGRDYDSELKAWARPAILGPAMVEALKGLPGLQLVDGSGSTSLAYHANNAIKKGQDFFLQELARGRGADFCVVGNLVSEELKDDNLRRTALISAVAEIRILEALEGGDVVVSDTATTLMARAARSLEIVGPLAMRGAAAKAAEYLKDDMQGLLLGQAHPPLLLKASFNGVEEAWLRGLRQGLGGLKSVQRFFKRGYSARLFRADLILRKSADEFLAELMAHPFDGFTLQREASPKDEGLVFTLRAAPIPTPTPTPTPKRPLDWRR